MSPRDQKAAHVAATTIEQIVASSTPQQPPSTYLPPASTTPTLLEPLPPTSSQQPTSNTESLSNILPSDTPAQKTTLEPILTQNQQQDADGLAESPIRRASVVARMSDAADHVNDIDSFLTTGQDVDMTDTAYKTQYKKMPSHIKQFFDMLDTDKNGVLDREVRGLLFNMKDASVRKISAINAGVVSNASNATYFETRFACRRR